MPHKKFEICNSKFEIPAEQAGFAPVLLLIAVVGVVGLMVFSNTQLKSQLNAPKGEVQGVLIADKGDDSGGSSDSSGGSGSSASDHSGSGDAQHRLTLPPPGLDNPSGNRGPEHPTVGFGNNKIATGGAKPLPLPAFLNRQRGGGEHESSESGELENEIENGDFDHLTFRFNGRNLEIETKDASGEAHRLPEASSGASLRIKLPGKGPGGGIVIEQTLNGLLIVTDGQLIQTNFPLNFDQTTGQLSVQLGDGTTRVIRVLPNQASDIAKKVGIQSQLGAIKLASSSGTLVYKMQGQRTIKILGFIPVTIPVSGDVNAETGTATTDQPWWAKFFQ
jgi:hypothetical protein